MKILKVFNYMLMGTLLAIRPLLGPAYCKFNLSCTNYAIMTFKEKNFFKAVWLITKRIFACNPFTH